jgi:Zn-dependent protease
MSPQRLSGIPLFKLFGIQVYLHWSWLVVAFISIQSRSKLYDSLGWNVAEYLSLFMIVLMHEFGHSLACRSVGGRADRILLWPLGGVAFVDPPQRPGAVLWSIVAGPLVNVILIPVTYLIAYQYDALRLHGTFTDFQRYLQALVIINTGLLVFNMLPIYPLDGGQILRALLWFMVGSAQSLLIATVIGLVGAGLGVALALFVFRDIWLTIIAGFAALQSWNGFQRAKAMGVIESTPRHVGVRCPKCGNAPPAMPVWTCNCGNPIDIFASQGRCPNCGAFFHSVPCPFCGKSSSLNEWTSQVSRADVIRQN